MAEVEILANGHADCTQLLNQHLINELLGRQHCDSGGEAHDHHFLHTSLAEQSDTLRDTGEGVGWRTWTKERRRAWMERGGAGHRA